VAQQLAASWGHGERRAAQAAQSESFATEFSALPPGLDALPHR